MTLSLLIIIYSYNFQNLGASSKKGSAGTKKKRKVGNDRKTNKKKGNTKNVSKKGLFSIPCNDFWLLFSYLDSKPLPSEFKNEIDFDDYAEIYSSEEDYTDDGDEGLEAYKPGGYHPVCIGDIFIDRYLVVEKLGWGHFSTVWMCQDKNAINHNQSFVALKIQKSASHYREAAFDEIELLTCVSNAANAEQTISEYGPNFDHCIVKLLDHFDHSGPNGKHVCMVFEPLGENLLNVIKKYDYKGMPIVLVQNFIRQICLALDFLHRKCSIIHTDLKPENILIAKPPNPPDDETMRLILKGGHKDHPSARKTKNKNLNTTTTTVTSTKKKSTKSKVNDTLKSIEGLTKQLESSKHLTAEQRKKLKKKLKKKKQRARKRKPTGKRESSLTSSPGDLANKLTQEMILKENGNEKYTHHSNTSDDILALADELAKLANDDNNYTSNHKSSTHDAYAATNRIFGNDMYIYIIYI